MRRRYVRAGDHRLAYRDAGATDAPPIVLLHGLASDSGTWEPALGPLADRGLRVLAPDLLGHGDSDKPLRADYSLHGFGLGVVDLLRTLGVSCATVVGHSLGGAIAMHLAYRHPAYAQRLVLVAAGGLGRQVHLALRAAALPGAHVVLRTLVNPHTARVFADPRVHRALRLTPENVVNLRRAGRALAARDGRAAFFASLRSVIEPGGQRGSMIEMRYLAEHMPTLIVWSEADHVIPVDHAFRLHQHLPSSRLELFPGSSHEPHRRYVERFADVVADFVRSTKPSPVPEC